MAKVPARLRSVTYTLSPMRTGVMHVLFKDWASGMAKRVTENAVDVGLFCALPTIATVMYARIASFASAFARDRSDREGRGRERDGTRGRIADVGRSGARDAIGHSVDAAVVHGDDARGLTCV